MVLFIRRVRTPSLPLLSLLALTGLLSGCATPRITADLAYFPPPPATARVVHLKSFNRLYEIVAPQKSARSIVRGQGMGPFVGRPAGIDYRDGCLLVCDAKRGVVHIWNLATGEATKLGDTGSIRLSKPVAVAARADGTVYVADTERGEVVAFGNRGENAVRIKPPAAQEYRPVDVAVTGSRLYVADLVRHRIDIFDTTANQWLRSIGELGSHSGQFYYPMGIAASPNGGLLVSDSMNSRIQIFDAQYEVQFSFGRHGNRYGDLGKPRHLTVGPDGTIFVADPEFAHVHLFDSRGRLLMLLGGGDGQTGSTPLPTGVAVAKTLPETLVAALLPEGFTAKYYLFVSNGIGAKRISLYAVGHEN